MSKSSLSQQEKMDMWFYGTRGFNIRAATDQKILENYKICCESGYFLQAVKLKKEIFNRKLTAENILNFKPTHVPYEYYNMRTSDQITADLLEYINIYVSKDGYSIDNNNLFLGRDKDSGIFYYGWDDVFDADLVIDTKRKIAIFTGCSEVDYTKDMDRTLKLIEEELFYG